MTTLTLTTEERDALLLAVISAQFAWGARSQILREFCPKFANEIDARVKALQSIQKALADMRPPAPAPDPFEDDHLSELRDDWHAEQREWMREDAELA